MEANGGNHYIRNSEYGEFKMPKLKVYKQYLKDKRNKERQPYHKPIRSSKNYEIRNIQEIWKALGDLEDVTTND